MKESTQFESQVQRWIAAGLIDAPAAERILAFEAGQQRSASLRWPVILAMVFGGILLAAGITLFVAAHWSEISPAMRLALMISLAGLFHVGGALVVQRFPVLATTLHAVGTATLGAAIFLAAQIFNLHENWATGVLLWTLGAAAGYVLLRDWVQGAMLAILLPTWLISQWEITTEWHSGGRRFLALGLITTAMAYLSARIGEQESAVRRALVWIGALALLPCVATAMFLSIRDFSPWRATMLPPLASWIEWVGWSVALLGPLLVAWLLRRRAAWINALWALWTYGLMVTTARADHFTEGRASRDIAMTVAMYALCAVGSVGLVCWGIYERRKERLNLGIVCFAFSVLFFYFDSFMGKLGRSASLLILGVVCLAGGYVLEVTRRRLVSRMEAIS